MLDWTDRHYRYFMRQITKTAILYTEMIVADAVIHGNRDKLLAYDNHEHPLVVQLGGSDPDKLSSASKICEEFGYMAINLNVGCPSSRVKSGNFGACLMQNPQLVSDCIKAMQDTVSIPITIKHRIGLGYEHDYRQLCNFVTTIAKTGCSHFVVHARNAILNGLSPKQNREIPPLKYDYVYQLKKDFPELNITINGGITTVEQIKEHLINVDGVMVGREAYYNPYLFSYLESKLFNNNEPALSRKTIANNMLEYLIKEYELKTPLNHITRHMLGLYHNMPKAKLWRQTLSMGIIHNNSIETYIRLVEQMDN